LTEKPDTASPQSTRLSGLPSNTVLIGKKPVMAYVTAVMMQVTAGGGDISVKARGRAISKAVDVVEVVRRRFFDGKLGISDVLIGTEMIGGSVGSPFEGQTRNVSTIEIKLKKRA